MLNDSYRDAVYAVRTLAKQPGFTAVAVLTLALGIGANTTVYSVVDAMIHFPIPGDDPDRIVFAFNAHPERDIQQSGVSLNDFLDWRSESRSFDHLSAAAGGTFNLIGAGEPERVQALRVSAGFFPTWGRPLTIGRAFRPEENTVGNERVAILSYRYWQQRFGGADDILERELTLDGESYAVVGVAPTEFFFPTRDTVMWTPLVHDRTGARDERGVFVVGRLKDQVSAEDASAELATIAARLEQEYPDTNDGWTASAMTIRDNLISGASLALTLLYGSITFVLLIACANVASLLVARATSRHKEIALRSTLGAGRLRLIRQLLIESLVLAFSGGVLGLVIGGWLMTVLRNWIAPDPNIGFIAEFIVMNETVLLHTLAISAAAAVIFGLAPALTATRRDFQATLKDGGKSSAGVGRSKLRSGLVVAEVAMALTLLGTSGALVRAFLHIYDRDPGFSPEGLLTLQLALPETDYPEPADVTAFYEEALEELAALPGVDAVATTTALPLTLFAGSTGSPIWIEGADIEDETQAPHAIDLIVSPGYFETLSVPILQGRSLERSDIEGALPVAVVSRATASRFWPDESSLGKRLRIGSDETEWLTVVGVSGNVQTRSHSVRNAVETFPHVFIPAAQTPRRATAVAIRTSLAPDRISESARRALHAVDSRVPVSEMRSMEAVIARIDTQNMFFVRVLTGLSIVALVLAGVGIYGIISFAVHQRSHEIGIRMALGAKPSSILFLVVRHGALLTLAGLSIGLLGAVSFVRFMGAELEGIAMSNASGALTYVGVSAVLLIVAKLASFLPARRAVKVDPLITLRYE